MNKSKTIIVLSGLCLALGAHAHDPAADGSRSRGEVKAELREMRASGELARVDGEDRSATVAPQEITTPALTRREVRQDLEAAKANGMLAALNSEDPMAMQRWREQHPTLQGRLIAG
ncbi:hypothetical protein [Pelomonas sp. KK5]|uniref:hypothetical protein n=1 Tax=Pelomonas sp. KK5 TaxID=1855730 RepID=UPI00097CB13E|nr:hypothetical protein [Pelomonas sp. KK5]